MMTQPILPRPDVVVTPTSNPTAPSGSVDIVISRDGKAKAYRAEGGSVTEIVRDAVKKVIDDGHTAEWLP